MSKNMHNENNAPENGWRDQTFRAGRDMDDCVEHAIRTGDYSLLSDQINRSLNQAVDAVHDTVFGSSYRTGADPGQSRIPAAGNGNVGNPGPGSMAADPRSWGSFRNGQGMQGGPNGPGPSAYEQAVDRSAYGGASYAIGSGHVKIKPDGFAKVEQAIGWVGFVTNLLGSIVMFLPETHIVGGIFYLIMALFFYWLKNKGAKKVKNIGMARRILKLAKGRDVLSVEEIGSALGLSKNETRKAIESMLQDGLLSGTVYLDKDGTTLMLSDSAYAQYKQVMQAYEQKKREEDASEAAAADAAKGAGSAYMAGHHLKEYEKMQDEAEARRRSKEKHDARLDAETQKILDEGHAFIRHIHEKNDEIPGKEMSEKLDRLEQIVTRIFDQVEKNPKSAPDLHKLMSYYLPTTQKLIDTYATLDAQHVQGSNIDSAKKEIENSLDVINDAYEKLFDSFFQSTAWDVGSDVTVMKSMLQQDGLTDDDLQKMQKQSQKQSQKQAGPAAAAGEKGKTPEESADQDLVQVGPLEFGSGAAAAQAPGEEEEQ